MPGYGRVLTRLFLLQASWNYERMQGVGFGYAAEPALRAFSGGERDARYHTALGRHTQFFNSHPYFAGLAVGAVLRAEQDGEDPERIARLRAALCSPLGSLGDRLIWAGWLPACAALAIVAFIFGARAWAAIGFLVLYNVLHVACRAWGLRAGWREGMMVATALGHPVIRTAARVAGPASAFVVGVALAVGLAWQVQGAPGATVAAAAGGALTFAAAARLSRGRAGPVALAALILGATWVVGLLWS